MCSAGIWRRKRHGEIAIGWATDRTVDWERDFAMSV
jgi:hypothetical protein